MSSRRYCAAGGGVRRMGPFASDVAAWRALKLTQDEQERQCSVHPRDARVWPELAPEEEPDHE